MRVCVSSAAASEEAPEAAGGEGRVWETAAGINSVRLLGLTDRQTATALPHREREQDAGCMHVCTG